MTTCKCVICDFQLILLCTGCNLQNIDTIMFKYFYAVCTIPSTKGDDFAVWSFDEILEVIEKYSVVSHSLSYRQQPDVWILQAFVAKRHGLPIEPLALWEKNSISQHFFKKGCL